MPIKGLDSILKTPRIGKLHLGIKKEGGYPEPTDHFVVSVDNSTSKDMVDAFKEVYGDKPKTIDITFPSDDLDVVFPRWYKSYSIAKGLTCKGDGIKAMVLEPKSGEWVETECAGVDCENYIAKKCKRIANLSFCLPFVKGIGVWQIDTSSINTIINIQSTFSLIRNVCKKISGLMLKLSVAPIERTVKYTDKTGKLVTQKKILHVLEIRTDKSWADILKENNEQSGGSNNNQFLKPKEDEKAPPEDLIADEETKDIEKEKASKSNDEAEIYFQKYSMAIMKATDLTQLKTVLQLVVKEGKIRTNQIEEIETLYHNKHKSLTDINE